ncbi:respiratory nitrate reductase subunit gamma [Halopseudomonas nanhaiensis]|uniref:respiratory nitrate reductase subunit gamma n=1 Tax=Halopseudomonas nanhaiensis TaxID=2830842 RepID=UPI001CBB58D9|nr:respiratory nitrate reductase subunit gamma [Halopseudomonas nanhaiensis]UAW99347.1 respiratory nitrate reductase subunit gamma [Halopseudomonas nanhaiensis]
MSNINLMLFGVYPYMALAVLIIGSWARFDLSQYTWKAGSSQLMANRNMRLASNLFHVGIIAVLAGHFVGLLTPSAVYHRWLSYEHKQLMAMLVGGFFGLLCLVGLSMLIWRRMTDPRVRAQSSTSDIVILWVLLVQLLLGLFTIYVSTAHMDGSQMVLLANWAQQIVTFQPVLAAASIEPVGLAYKLHVFLGITLFVLFPFTRLVHVVSAPVWYLGRRYQIVRLKSGVRTKARSATSSRAAYQPSRPSAPVRPAPAVGPGAAVGGMGTQPVTEAPRQD